MTRSAPQQIPPVLRLDFDERCAVAQTKVQRLEAALALFGEEDSPEKDAIKEFLARAQEQAKVKPVDVREKSCENSLQKCTKHLEEAKAAVVRCEEEVEDRSRFAGSRTHTSTRSRSRSESSPEANFRSPDPCSPSGSRFRGSLREHEETTSQTTSVPRAYLESWMSDKHMELRDALEFGSRVVEIALGRRLIDVKKSRVVRSSYHVRDREHGHHVKRSARYGYRGVRLGEAVKPGPPNSTARHRSMSRNGVRATVADSCSEDDIPLAQLSGPSAKLLDMLEFDLTHDNSDVDENVSNVVPRIGRVSQVPTSPAVSSTAAESCAGLVSVHPAVGVEASSCSCRRVGAGSTGW